MDCETYARSRLYLSRYRVLYDLKVLVSTHPNPIPLEERTAEWFVTKYVDSLSYPESGETQRLIYQPDDEEIDPKYNDGRLIAGRRRRLRHISRAEIRSLLGMHAKWLVQDQKRQKQNKVLDPATWGRWLADSRRYRAEAQKEGYSWGIFHGGDDEYEINDRYSSSDDDSNRMDVDPAPAVYTRKGKPKKKKSPQTVNLSR